MFSFVVAALVISANAHSWLECSKYGNANTDPPLTGTTYDANLCTGWPRQFSLRRGADFGVDTGFNVQPGPNWCNGRTGTADPNFPAAEYVAGEKVRLTWPAKNHDAEACTNPFIPDTAMKIYATPMTQAQSDAGNNGPADLANWQLIVDFKQTQIGGKPTPEGFQRCPDFCGARGTDKAICFQDMQVPSNMAAGRYTFLWYWIFNAGGSNTAYTTCFDVTVLASGTPSTGATSAPQTTVAGGGNGGGNNGGGGSAATNQQSLSFEVASMPGVLDQTALTSSVASQLSLSTCAVTVTSFASRFLNGQQGFSIFFAVNVATADVASKITMISASSFATTLGAVTKGTVTVTPPTAGGPPVNDSCSGGTVSSTQYSLQIDLQLAVAPASAPPALDVAVAIDDTLANENIASDVGCVKFNATVATATDYKCSIIVFSQPNALTTQSFANTPTFKSVVASKLACCTTAQVTIQSVSQAVGPSSATGVGFRVSGLGALVIAIVLTVFGLARDV